MALPEFDPRPILVALSQGGVEFVVIGGIAMQAWGSAQFTRDLDVCYATDDENLRRLGRVLIGLDARLRGVADSVPFVPDGRTLQRAQILTLDTRHGALDVLAAPSGFPGYAELADNALKVDWAGARIRVASLDHLIAMKSAAGRPKDLIAVEELEAIRRLARER